MTPGGEGFNPIPVTIYGHCDGVTSLPSRSAALRSWHWPLQQSGSAWARRRRAAGQQAPHVTISSPPLPGLFGFSSDKPYIGRKAESENADTQEKNPTNKPILRALYRELLHGEKKTCQVTSVQMYLIT